MTTAIQNDIEAIEDKFVSSLGAGKSAARHLLALVEAVVSSRDTTIISRAAYRAEGKGDKQAAGILKFVTGQVFPGAKYSAPKEGAPKITIKGITADTAAVDRFRKAVEKNLSIRHSAFREAIKAETDTVEKEFDPKAWAERTIKAKGKDNLEAMIAALQAQRG